MHWSVHIVLLCVSSVRKSVQILDKYLIIDEKEIVFHFTDKSLDRVLWSDICFFKMRKAAFLLYTDKSHFIYIPKDAFGLNEEYLYFYRHMLMKINSKEV